MARAGGMRRWEMAAIAAILLLALGLRLYHLDAQSLWNDEGTSVALAQRDLATIARHASYDIHPPLYYYLLHGWIALAGTSEVAVRSLSVVAGVGLVAGVWALARRLVGPVAAALAALLAAVAPFGVYYAQEARMYIWAALFGLLATIAFERLLSTYVPSSRTPPSSPRASSPSSRASARDLDSRDAAPAAEDGGAPRAAPRGLDDVGQGPSAALGAGGGALSSRASSPSSRASARDLDARDAPAAAGVGGGAASRVRRMTSRWPWGAAHTAAYALAAVAAVYSHYLGATVLVVHNLAFVAWWAWRWRADREGRSGSLAPYSGRGWGRGAPWRVLAAWALLQAAVLLAYVPWLAVSWRSLRNWPAVSADFSALAMLSDALRALTWGPAAEARRMTAVVALGVAALALPGFLGAWGGGPAAAGAGDDALRGSRSLAGARGAPPSSAAGASRASRSLAGARDDGGSARGGGGGVRAEGRGVRRDGTTEAEYPSPRWFGAALLALYLVTPIALMALASLERPMYKTKFALLAAPPFHVLVAAGIVTLGRRAARLSRRRVVGIAVASLLALGTLAPAARGLSRLYWDPATYRDDYRGIAAYIASTAGPDDAILINAPSQIETFGYYYRGPLPTYPLPRQRPIDAADARAELEAMAARHDRIYAVLWATDESDPERVIEGWLDAHAFKAMDRWFGNVRLAMWALPRSTEGAEVVPAGYVLGEGVRLAGYSILTPEPAGGDVLQVALHWEALAPIAARYKVFVHLVDAGGTIVTQRDSEPGGGARLTSDWAPGEAITDLYGLLIPPDTPPGEHVLRVGMCGLDGGSRLPVTLDGQHVGDAIDLARVTVK